MLQASRLNEKVNTQNLKDYILEHGCYAPQENGQIWETWFANSPRYLFRAVDKKYKITSRVLCDIGCSYGENLLYSESGSYGIETDQHKVQFAKGLDLEG